MWVPDPGNYHKEVWTKIGMPNGPATYDDLVKAAPEIKKAAPQMQIPIGIGLSQDIDSNMAVRNILWCHGGSIQDKDGNVVLNSPETLAALEYTKKLYSAGMTQAVLSWNAASNNQAFNAQETAYILNSISAYRTAQDNKLPVVENYFFTPALKGPKVQLASEHVMSGYVVWKFSKNQEAAKEFLIALVDASRDSMMASKLYNFPSFYGAPPRRGHRWPSGPSRARPGSPPSATRTPSAPPRPTSSRCWPRRCRGRRTSAIRATATRPRARSSTPT